MNTSIRNYLGVALILATLALGGAGLAYVSYYHASIDDTTQRVFSASGDGKAVAVPDVAEFSMSVISQGGKDIGSLLTTNTDKVNQAIAFVKGQGVDEKDIQTSGFNVDPRYQYYSCPSPISPIGNTVQTCPPADIVGYTVTQTVDVKIRDFTKIGAILSGVVGAGANSVSSLSFMVDDPTKVQAEAREQAIAKAKEKAQEVAAAAGFTLGKLIGVDEGWSQPPVVYSMDKSYAPLAMGGSGAVATPAPTIEPGSQEVQVTVTLRYAIE